ncbi:MAG TPA: NADH-quinone oxidoreductase subunit C, partial [Limnochordia bacterium]
HPRVPRFEVVYHFLALPAHRRVRLRVPVPEEHPIVPTISHLWPSANWAEREVYDLFGIRFEGHPNLQRIVLPADWQGHPLRKDYPLRGPRAAEAEKLPAGERWDPLGARITPNKVRRPGAQGAAGALDAGGGRSKG